jgi:hypothetical protein
LTQIGERKIGERKIGERKIGERKIGERGYAVSRYMELSLFASLLRTQMKRFVGFLQKGTEETEGEDSLLPSFPPVQIRFLFLLLLA